MDKDKQQHSRYVLRQTLSWAYRVSSSEVDALAACTRRQQEDWVSGLLRVEAVDARLPLLAACAGRTVISAAPAPSCALDCSKHAAAVSKHATSE